MKKFFSKEKPHSFLKTIWGIILFTVFLSSCGFNNSQYRRLTDRYSIGWKDYQSTQSIRYNTDGKLDGPEVLGPYVFAVGYNQEYIIIKQHPLCDDFVLNSCKPDQNITNYYIIKIFSEQTFGPFSETEFADKKKVFGIEELDFSVTFPENPQ